jgi:spoIIIJ-associated protein
MNTIEKSGKTLEAAVAAALAALGVEESRAEITVVEEGSKGFLGMGGKDAVVRVRAKTNEGAEEKAVGFLRNVFLAMGLAVQIDAAQEENVLKLDLSGERMGLLIGKRGETLDALEHLTSLTVNRGDGGFVRVNLDTENYRAKRGETLTRLAESLAASVTRTKKKIILEPMSAHERRVIHATLQEHEGVETHSVGDEPNRKVVIQLKKK